MTRILTVLTPRVRKMHFRVRCINLHIKCPSFSSRYLAARVVSLRQLWGGKRKVCFAAKVFILGAQFTFYVAILRAGRRLRRNARVGHFPNL